MRKFIGLSAVLMLVGVLLGACGGTPARPAPTPFSTSEGSDNASDESAASDVVTQFPRPSAPPAENENFREDHVSHVASTGRPQLIEVFSYD